jgi:hypothetical protein
MLHRLSTGSTAATSSLVVDRDEVEVMGALEASTCAGRPSAEAIG